MIKSDILLLSKDRYFIFSPADGEGENKEKILLLLNIEEYVLFQP
jgi:hypothetical protein